MFEKFLSENAADFRQRYEGTFGFYKGEDGKKILTKLQAITDRVCHFEDKNGLEYRLNADSDKDIGFEFIPPKSGYYNISDDAGGSSAVLVSRVPARQFQRGLSGKNTKITKLYIGTQQAIPFAFPLLEKIYLNPVPINKAFALWKKTGGAVAISKQLALDGPSGKILLYENVLGTFKEDKNHFSFKLSEPTLWRTEITDALRALDCTTEVA